MNKQELLECLAEVQPNMSLTESLPDFIRFEKITLMKDTVKRFNQNHALLWAFAQVVLGKENVAIYDLKHYLAYHAVDGKEKLHLSIFENNRQKLSLKYWRHDVGGSNQEGRVCWVDWKDAYMDAIDVITNALKYEVIKRIEIKASS